MRERERFLQEELRRIVAELKEIRSNRRQELIKSKELGVWSDKELNLYRFLKDFFGRYGFTPTLKEIKEGLGIRSSRGLNLLLNKLENRAVISRVYGKKRSINIPGASLYATAG